MDFLRNWWQRRHVARTTTRRSPVFKGRGLSPRRVTIYLPPGYDAARAQPYPLLLALDGQTMPRWRLAEILAELVSAGQIEPAVIAAVPASAQRMNEYGTAGALDYAGRGRHAKAFQDLLAEDMLPWMRGNYHVTTQASRTGIFGASLGGLCALDTAWRRPQVFGFAGVFSGSLWWRTDDSGATAQQASRIMHHRVRTTAERPALRLWFQAGTHDETEDRDSNGVIDAIQDTTELMDELVAKGFRRGGDVVYHEVAGGEHHESTWARALWEFLRWALPPRVG